MTKMRFSTDRQVAALRPIDGKRTDFYHADEKGFICRVSAKSKTWLVSHNVKIGKVTKRRKLTIGVYPTVSLANAREKAQEIKSDGLSKGVDMVGAKMEYKSAPTIKDIMNCYFREAQIKPTTRKENNRISEKHIVPSLGTMKALDLTRGDVKALYNSVNGTVMANRVVGLLGAAFNSAFIEELINSNPFPSLKKIKTAEAARDRILKDSEIKSLWHALEHESANMKDSMRLLFLLGQRSGETLSMAICDICVETKTWTLPATKTKNGKPNVLPVPPLAWSIIKPRLSNEKWIFPSAYNTTKQGAKGDGHSKSTKDCRRRLKEATSIRGWITHDFRRTCRTLMSRAGIFPHIAEQVLGHVQAGVVAVYDQHSYLPEKYAALEKVENIICEIINSDS
jgi:integrase